MKNIFLFFVQICLFESLVRCYASNPKNDSFSPRFNETCDSMENAKLCEENCRQLYQLCLEKNNDETTCSREFFICIDGQLTIRLRLVT